MSDVYAIFGTLLALGIVFPGMLTAWWLLFPSVVDRASERVLATPWRSLGLGMLMTGLLAVPIVVLLALPFAPAKFAGGLLLIASLAFASVGTAGLAAAMARQWSIRSQSEAAGPAVFVRGAIALELAAAFPLLGWLLVIPLTILISLGAATFGALGWQPKPRPAAEQESNERVLIHEPQSA